MVGGKVFGSAIGGFNSHQKKIRSWYILLLWYPIRSSEILRWEQKFILFCFLFDENKKNSNSKDKKYVNETLKRRKKWIKELAWED